MIKICVFRLKDGTDATEYRVGMKGRTQILEGKKNFKISLNEMNLWSSKHLPCLIVDIGWPRKDGLLKLAS